MHSGSESEGGSGGQNLLSRRVVSFRGLSAKVVPVPVGTVQASTPDQYGNVQMGRPERDMIPTYRSKIVLECWGPPSAE